jgi:potassium efflux system protein
MLRFSPLLCLLAFISFGANAIGTTVPLSQLDSALEQATAQMDSADPTLETLQKSYRETRGLLLEIKRQDDKLEAYSAARANAYQQAQEITSELDIAQTKSPIALDESLRLEELEQTVQLYKSDLSVVQNRLNEASRQKTDEASRPSDIREQLATLGSSLPDLEANLKLFDKASEPGSKDEARLWLAQAQLASNRTEKAALDEELLSQPMRLKLLAAQYTKLDYTRAQLEQQIQQLEVRSSELRQNEADQALAAAESAKENALGKHAAVQELAAENTVLSASLGERNAAIEELREEEQVATTQADQFERELRLIERKLEILGMTKTVGEILREQVVGLPTIKSTNKRLAAIAELSGNSSLRQMELRDMRRQLADMQAYIDRIPVDQDAAANTQLKEDLTKLALSRRELVKGAIDTESTYSRTLADLDFSVHRLANAVEHYRGFISERLLWVQSRDSISWSLFTELPGQLSETFSPQRWYSLTKWYVQSVLSSPPILFLFLIIVILAYFTSALKVRLTATGNSVGIVRIDSFLATAKSLLYTLILMLRWPLLIVAIALPFNDHQSDMPLPPALFDAFIRTSVYYIGMEFLRYLLHPRGLLEAHFRWPALRVSILRKRVVTFEQSFLPAAFIGILFLHLYPTDVGGSMATIAVITMLLSLAYFFYRLPHFVQGKMDHLFIDQQVRLHRSWGSLARTVLAWAPLAMIVAVFFGYTYTAIEFSVLLMQSVALFVVMLLLYELGTRWLRITRRRLRLKMQQESAKTNDTGEEATIEDDTLEHDPELLGDEGTKFLNAMLLIGSVFGLAVVWSDVFPALGILDSIELWQSSDVVNGQNLVVSTTLGDAFAALVISLLGWIIIRRLPGLLEILLRRSMEVGAASAYAFATVVKYSLTAVVVISVLSILGGNWSQIQWAVAALSLGIGFGLQEIVANFISGIIILFEQPIRVGDTVTVGDTTGIVTKIHMRATTIRDWDRRELLVPNKEFVTGRLLNWSLSDPITRLHIELGVAYGTDMDEAMAIVCKAATQHPLILDDPAPFVTFDEFGDNSLNISLRCYLEELEKRLSTASAIRLEINRTLKAANICVSFPQRDVHLDTKGPLDIRLVDSPN